MFFVIKPLTFVFVSIGVKIFTIAFFFSVSQLTFISISFREYVYSLSMKFIVFPVSKISISVFVIINPLTISLVIKKFSFIGRTIMESFFKYIRFVSVLRSYNKSLDVVFMYLFIFLVKFLSESFQILSRIR